jgi:two-component system cell cycle response regulator DivK
MNRASLGVLCSRLNGNEIQVGREMPSTTPCVVLLVQPERDDRDMYADFLRFRGFQPIPVSTAAEALSNAPRADVIVTAILLPGQIDGVELTIQLRHDERTRHIPIIVLTACAWAAERDRAVAAGCNVFLTKPYLPEALVGEIRRVITRGHVPKPQMADAPPPSAPRFRRTS